MIFTCAIREGEWGGRWLLRLGKRKISCLIPLAVFFTLFHSHRESDSSEREFSRVYRTYWFDSSEQRKLKMCPQDWEMRIWNPEQLGRKEDEKCSLLSSYKINVNVPSVEEVKNIETRQSSAQRVKKKNMAAVKNSRWRHGSIKYTITYKLSSGLYCLLKICIVYGSNP